MLLYYGLIIVLSRTNAVIFVFAIGTLLTHTTIQVVKTMLNLKKKLEYLKVPSETMRTIWQMMYLQ